MGTYFPARHSTLEPQELAKYVSEHWDIGGNPKCTFFHRGENDNYRIEAGSDRYCLRAYRTRHSNSVKIDHELNVLTELGANGLPVSVPLPSFAGDLWTTVNAIEGPRAMALFAWAPGSMLKRDERRGWDAFGRELARLHNARLSTPGLPHYDAEALLIKPTRQWIDRILVIGMDGSEVQDLSDQLMNDMKGLWDQLPQSFVHGDAAGGNAHLDDEGRLTWFDFLWTGTAPSVWDLATFRRGAGQIQANWQLALQAYESERPLSVAERQAIPYLAASRCIFVTSLIIDECDIDLHAEATESWFNSRLRELRGLVSGSHWSN